ncbi:uncharacterized protein LOC104907492 [Beta vulgaris subsp. vulgaris]|uniref:uncharacterized protein LOC104907492 n=1 Tax=Beta vulgaris subsp. vulgaris TaxID=3555 RepID=UPI00053F3DC7|nr:uncharacterized protein LOC104907492 [Beta vulgaris subsp. vulgaris]
MSWAADVEQQEANQVRTETSIVMIEFENIQEEVEYWSSAVVTTEGFQFFDQKPLITRMWDPDMLFDKSSIQKVPIWIKLPDLALKYYGEKSLFKIAGLVGHAVQMDKATISKDRLQYARVMVEPQLQQRLPDTILFCNDYGRVVEQRVEYEWRPTLCHKCEGIGHGEEECRKGAQMKKWVQKKPVRVDNEGFQQVGNGVAPVDKLPEVLVHNSFNALLEDVEENKEDEVGNKANDESVNTRVATEQQPEEEMVDKGQGLTTPIPNGYLLETRVKSPNLGRIILGWCPGAFHVSILTINSQFIHCEVKPTQGGRGFLCTFVYVFHDLHSRAPLWEGIKEIKRKADGGWVLMGGFNVLSSVEDRIGSSVRVSEIRPMLECMNECGLSDVKASGRYFTWSNKQEGSARVFSRIDRVITNSMWLDSYDQAIVAFLPQGNFDHTPVLLSVYDVPMTKDLSSFVTCGVTTLL